MAGSALPNAIPVALAQAALKASNANPTSKAGATTTPLSHGSPFHKLMKQHQQSTGKAARLPRKAGKSLPVSKQAGRSKTHKTASKDHAGSTQKQLQNNETLLQLLAQTHVVPAQSGQRTNATHLPQKLNILIQGKRINGANSSANAKDRTVQSQTNARPEAGGRIPAQDLAVGAQLSKPLQNLGSKVKPAHNPSAPASSQSASAKSTAPNAEELLAPLPFRNSGASATSTMSPTGSITHHLQNANAILNPVSPETLWTQINQQASQQSLKQMGTFALAQLPTKIGEKGIKSAPKNPGMSALSSASPLSLQLASSAHNQLAASLSAGGQSTPGQFADALNHQMLIMVTQGQQHAVLSLNPPALGQLHVHLSLNQQNLNALFVTPHPDVRQALEAAMPGLRQMLGQQGLSLGGAFVAADGNTGTGQTNQNSGKQTSRRGKVTLAGATSGVEMDLSLPSRAHTASMTGIINTYI